MSTTEKNEKISTIKKYAVRGAIIVIASIAACFFYTGIARPIWDYFTGSGEDIRAAQEATDKTVDDIKSLIESYKRTDEEIQATIREEVKKNHGEIRKATQEMSADNVVSALVSLVAEYRRSVSNGE